MIALVTTGKTSTVATQRQPAVIYAARAMRSATASLAALGALGALGGCPYPALPSAGPREVREFPVKTSRDVDLLFLVDDSPSMSDKQVNLAAKFSRFIDVLNQIPGGLPDLHIGIATSDMGTKGADDAAPGAPIGTLGLGGCRDFGKNGALQLFGAPVTGPFISDIADGTGARQRNYTGNLSDVFAQIAKGAGAGGCGFEQPLAAVQHALDPANQANQGFVRPDAYLGVIILTDEDDCSLSHSSLLTADTTVFGELQSFRCTRFGLVCDQGGKSSDEMNQTGTKAGCHPDDGSPYLTKIADHARAITALKADASKVFVAAIAGPTEPFATELRMQPGFPIAIPALAHSCSYLGGDINGDGVPDAEVADPPIRLKAFLDQFPGRSAFSSICQQDLSGGLAAFGDLVKIAVGDPCIEAALADVEPGATGEQADCTITAVTHLDRATPSETQLPHCAPDDATARNPPCWRLVTDPTSCPLGGHTRVVVEGADRLAADARIRASCVVEMTP